MLARRTLLSVAAAAAATHAPQGLALGPNHTLVVVFQRFAADWINLLVPKGDPNYAALRPTLKISNGISLNSDFALSPHLASLKPIYDAGDLAFVAATGWLDEAGRSHSHFIAQSLMERAAATGVNNGWLARALSADPYANSSIWRAIAAEAAVPASLQGHPSTVAVKDFGSYSHGSAMGDKATAAIKQLANIAGVPGNVLRRLSESIEEVKQSGIAALTPHNGAVYPNTRLGQGLKTAAQAIHGGYSPRVVTVTSDDDWDTHVSQTLRHANNVPNFANALAAFNRDLDVKMNEVTLVTMTEFGRTARESLDGTEHGSGSSMLVMSRRIAGAQVYGNWPGLGDNDMINGRDLRPTTDYRAVLSEILVQHLGLSETDLAGIFPTVHASSSNWRNFTL